MKKTVFLISLLAVCLVSCQKQGPAALKGSYSFKTGGSLDVSGRYYEIVDDTVRIDTTVRYIDLGVISIPDTSYTYVTRPDTLSSRDTTIVLSLIPESGQMRIVSSGSEMKLAMNITGGDPVVFDATAKGSEILLSPTRRAVKVRGHRKIDIIVTCDMTVSGRGKRYDNTILFNFDYSGKYVFDGIDGSVSESRVDCIATENE